MKRNNQKSMIHTVAFLLILIGVCAFMVRYHTILSFAATPDGSDEAKFIRVLTKNSDLFQSNHIVLVVVRLLGWYLIRLLAFIASQCADLFDAAFGLLDFTTWSYVNSYVARFADVWKALVILAILFLGMVLVFNHEKKPKLAMNICIAVLVFTSSTYLLNQINLLFSEDLRTSIIGTNTVTNTVYELVGDSVLDLMYIDKKVGLMNVKEDNRVTLDHLTKEDVDLIDINTLIKPDDVSDSDVKTLLGKRIAYAKGNKTLIDASGAFGVDLLSDYYYRYKIEWIGAILGLAAMVIVYICLAYKVVRILFEIVIHRILALLYSANLGNSQKVLKILDSIKDSYIVLFLIMVCVKCYLLGNKYITNNVEGAVIAPLLKLFLALAVIDGPNIIQQIAGIDAGLSNGVGKMIAGMNGIRLAGSVGRGMVSGGNRAFQSATSPLQHSFSSGSSENNVTGNAIGAFSSSTQDYGGAPETYKSNDNPSEEKGFPENDAAKNSETKTSSSNQNMNTRTTESYRESEASGSSNGNSSSSGNYDSVPFHNGIDADMKNDAKMGNDVATDQSTFDNLGKSEGFGQVDTRENVPDGNNIEYEDFPDSFNPLGRDDYIPGSESQDNVFHDGQMYGKEFEPLLNRETVSTLENDSPKVEKNRKKNTRNKKEGLLDHE